MPIHPKAHIGAVHLTVADLERSLIFYRQQLGFADVWRRDGSAGLGVEDRVLLVLHESEHAPRPHRTTGLYHFAILVPSRLDLARSLRHFAEIGTRMQGFSDHRVSEALYLADPDGIGIEVYRDRPREEWRMSDGRLQMTTDPLDVESLLQEAEADAKASGRPSGHSWTGLAPGTTIGHVHLHVSFIEDSEQFYREVLGFDLMQRYGESASFLSAGGYHHHIAVNVWAGIGAPQPPPGAIGLKHFEIVLPTAGALGDVARRVNAAGVAADIAEDVVRVSDPSGNRIELITIPSDSHEG
jgi:catechol 2,3-dioxygenase